MAEPDDMQARLEAKHPTLELPLLECLPGWEPILDRMFLQMGAVGQPIHFFQIKEKWGLLVVDLAVGTFGEDVPEEQETAVAGIVRQAEAEAAVTCEVCGWPGRLRTERHWLSTLCDEHNAERNR